MSFVCWSWEHSRVAGETWDISGGVNAMMVQTEDAGVQGSSVVAGELQVARH